jgi:hypothetical protein
VSRVGYLGIDWIEEMAVNATKKFPNGHFQQFDSLEFRPADKFDYVLAVGVYNLEVGDNDVVMERIIGRMFDLCTMGVAVSMTYGGVAMEGESHGFDPIQILRHCLVLTPWVALRKDYLPRSHLINMISPNFQYALIKFARKSHVL